MKRSRRTLCFSVRLESLVSISDKAYKAHSYDGSEDILPKSCVFGQDYEVLKSDAYWIAAWVLPKKQAWFDENGKRLPTYSSVHHKPSSVAPLSDNSIDSLVR